MKNSDLTYSEIVYLFAEQFVPTANIFDEKEFISDNKLKQRELAEILCLSALLCLIDKKLINLEIKDEKLFWIFKRKVLIAKKMSGHGPDLSSLEKKILCDANERENVYYIIKNLIPHNLRNPWNVVISIVRDDLIQKGYLSKEKYWYFFTRYHYNMNQEKNPVLEKRLSQTKKSLLIFKSYKCKELYEKTSNEIRDAIKSKLPCSI